MESAGNGGEFDAQPARELDDFLDCKQPYWICLMIARSTAATRSWYRLSIESMRFRTQDLYAQAGHRPSVMATVLPR